MSALLQLVKPFFLDNNSIEYSGAKLFIYAAGTTTKSILYSDRALTTTIANPVVLNARGEPTSDGSTACSIWLADSTYKVVLAPPTDTDPPASPIWTVDQVVNGSNVYDKNGNLVLSFVATAGAVNSVVITNKTTGIAPLIGSTGEANIGLTLTDSNGNAIISGKSVATATNSLQVTNATTGNSVLVGVSGTANRAITINDSNANALITTVSTASATNGLKVTNATTGNPVLIGVTGTANRGIVINDSNANAELTLVSVATATNGLQITNATTANPVLLGITGTANRGLKIQDSNGNTIQEEVSVATAVNNIKVTNAATATNPVITASGSDTNVGLDLLTQATGTINLKGNATQAGQLRIYENTANGTNSTGFKVAESVAADVTFTVPSVDGTAGQAIQTNGSGILSFGSKKAVLQFSTIGGTLADGNTSYYTLTGFDTAANVAMSIPFTGTLKNLYMNTAAVTAGSRATTVMINGSASTLTCTATSSATTASDLTHTVSVIAGDLIAIRMVTSGGTETVAHRCSMELDATT